MMRKSPKSKATAHSGFTLVELVAVIVLLGVLAVTALPRFVSISEEAHSSAVAGTGAAFRAGVNQVHLAWLADGARGAILNFLPLSDTRAAGDLSVNTNGWPADTRGVSLTLNSNADCVDVWNAVMQDTAPTVAEPAGTADYLALHSSGSCTYTYQAVTTFTITYNSNTGEVGINTAGN